MCSTCNGSGVIRVHHPQYPWFEGCPVCHGSGKGKRRVRFDYTITLVGDTGTTAVQTGVLTLSDDQIRLGDPGGYERARLALLGALASGRMRVDWEPKAYEVED